MEIIDKIIDYLVRNRVSTTEVADALGKTGVLPGLVPVNVGHYKAGKVKWIYAYEESNWPVHEQVQDIEEDCVILVDAFDCGDRAIFGELVSKYLLLYRQSRALVIQGNMRDTAALIKENWPIWCAGHNPVGCFNRKPSAPFDEAKRKEYSEKYDGAIAVCDDCGVVIIPKEKITEEFLVALHHIEDQEDIWFDRLNHYKENTFEIVCMKNYLKDETYMSRRNKTENE
ncbi:MAG: RraA family protein [Agathobacter sp.]|nr:RraA family protein [Agathobacter sp.]